MNTYTSNSIVDIQKYMQAQNIDCKSDPFLWWHQNKGQYPLLFELVMKYLCIPGTSVPSERLFSKAGELISVKRNSLKPKHVDMYLFLNNQL